MMIFPQITGKELLDHMPEGCKEDVIEQAWAQALMHVCPCTYEKKSFDNGRTDGIFRFGNENGDFKFWMCNESKRDEPIDSSALEFSLLQNMMYLGNVFYDVNYDLEVNRFGGVLLTSRNYFCHVPRLTMMEVMERFEPLWHKYYRVRPCEAYWKRELLNHVFEEGVINNVIEITPEFRLDVIIKSIYEKWNLQ